MVGGAAAAQTIGVLTMWVLMIGVLTMWVLTTG